MPQIRQTQILPLVLIVVDVGAALICLLNKEYKRAIYWAAAAILSWSVTF